MIISIEIPDKNRQDFANAYGLPNDETLETNGAQMLSNLVYKEMRIKIIHDSEAEIKAIADAKLSEGEIKPATDAK